MLTSVYSMESKDIETYFMNMALRHYGRSFYKNKEDHGLIERYFKCWVNDMYYVLFDYNINVETFLNNLINNQKQITCKKDYSKSETSLKTLRHRS